MPPFLSPLLLALLTLVSALLSIVALSDMGLPRELALLAKPLTTVLIILYAWPRGAAQPRMQRLLRAGLLFSLGGDIALLWPEQGFLPGLLSFLIAHLCYILGFTSQGRFARPWWPFAMFAGIAAAVLYRLWPGIPAALQAPVLVYVACLASMAAQAWSWWRSSLGQASEALARNAAWGGTLFLLSDSLIAINKFAGTVPLAALWILASYWVAQWLLASSLGKD